MEFAKDILKDHEKEWGKFPIYLKATAGMRQLSYNDREAILREVREFLSNPETCPFFFSFDQARVISGEEVRAYCQRLVEYSTIRCANSHLTRLEAEGEEHQTEAPGAVRRQERVRAKPVDDMKLGVSHKMIDMFSFFCARQPVRRVSVRTKHAKVTKRLTRRTQLSGGCS